MPKFGRRTAFAASLVLLLLLALAQVLSLSYDEETELRQATLQSGRCQRVAKVALILSNHSIDQETRVQAVSELQNTLPAWEAQQARMLAYHTDNLRLLTVQTQSDFAAIDAAAHNILAHPGQPADPVQVAIIVQKEHGYSTTMLQLATLVQQRLEEIDHETLLFEQIVTGLLFVAIVMPPIWDVIAGRMKQRKAKEAPAQPTEGGNE